MKKIIIIKYGELTTKKDNINFFIKTLRDNITLALEGIEHNNIYDKGRMFIETDCFDEVTNILIKTFGIHEINIGYKIDYTDIEEIGSKLLDLLKDKKFNTFKVETKRSNKNYPSTSMEVNSKLGAFILKNIANVKVDVHNPELEINIEIRYKDIYIYFAKFQE